MNFILNVIYQGILSISSAILYRLGGSSKVDQDKEFPWIPRWFKNIPKKRDVMSNIVKLFGVFLLGIYAPIWVWFISFGLLWASLSSYWDWMFGYDNHYMYGFMCGFSLLPLVIFGNLGLVPFLIQSVVLGLTMGLWSKYNGNATKEELGRGTFLTLSNLILILF